MASQSGRVVTHNGEEVFLVSQIVLRDATNGEIVRTMDGLCEWVDGDEWGPDSEWGRSCVPFPDTPFPDWPWDLVFSPDGSMLAMSGQNTPAVVVWDTSTGEIIAMPTVPHEIDPEWVQNAAFSPDRRPARRLAWFGVVDVLHRRLERGRSVPGPGDGRGSGRQSDLHPGW